MIRQLAHSCFFTDHLPQMVDFYAGRLELPIRFALNDKEGNPFGFYFDCGNSTFIEIFNQAGAVREWGGTVGELTPGTRYKHLCLEVTGLEQFKTKLESCGVEVSPITVGMDHSRQAWIHDPDGNAIELMEYTGESLQLARTR